ncbi:MAG: glucose 1-dehydrogenase [Pseudomonadales bacterium]
MGILEKFKLDGKVALVTGAGRGIGAGCAKAFAEAGANVVIGARTESQLQTVAAEISTLGSEAHIVTLDVMDPAQRENFVSQAMQRFGRIDILVNNAGGWPPKPFFKTSVEEFESAFRFNVSTAFAMTQLAVPKMVESAGEGSVINISSIAGQEPSAQFAAYGVAKSSLSFLTRELAQEFAPKVRVNAIGVGSTKTEALNTVLSPEIEKTMVELTPMARLGEVEDIAACALYLASPASSYLTGDVVQVNGGLNALNMQMPRAFE